MLEEPELQASELEALSQLKPESEPLDMDSTSDTIGSETASDLGFFFPLSFRRARGLRTCLTGCLWL